MALRFDPNGEPKHRRSLVDLALVADSAPEVDEGDEEEEDKVEEEDKEEEDKGGSNMQTNIVLQNFPTNIQTNKNVYIGIDMSRMKVIMQIQIGLAVHDKMISLRKKPKHLYHAIMEREKPSDCIENLDFSHFLLFFQKQLIQFGASSHNSIQGTVNVERICYLFVPTDCGASDAALDLEAETMMSNAETLRQKLETIGFAVVFLHDRAAECVGFFCQKRYGTVYGKFSGCVRDLLLSWDYKDLFAFKDSVCRQRHDDLYDIFYKW